MTSKPILKKRVHSVKRNKLIDYNFKIKKYIYVILPKDKPGKKCKVSLNLKKTNSTKTNYINK